MSKVLELCERIEKLKALSTQGKMTVYRRDQESGAFTYDVENEKMLAMATTLLDLDNPKAKNDAYFIAEIANQILTLTKIIRLQHEALEHYSASYQQVVLSGTHKAKQTLEETNRIASGSEEK